MPGERDAVQERGRPRVERLHQRVADHHAAERRVAGGDALGEGDDVRLVVIPLGAEVVAEPAERAYHLVGDQQHAVPVADLPYPLEVPGRRREAAAGVLHRLEEDRGDRLRALAQDRPLDLVRGPAAELHLVTGHDVWGPVEISVRHPDAAGRQRLERVLDGDRLRALAQDRPLDLVRGPASELHLVTGHEVRGPVEVGVRHPDAARRQRLERVLDVGQAGDGQRAHRRAVIGDGPAEHLV